MSDRKIPRSIVNKLIHISSLLQTARRKEIVAELACEKVFQSIEKLGITADLSAIKVDAENADNLEEAISCFIQYGEFGIEAIIDALMVEVSHI